MITKTEILILINESPNLRGYAYAGLLNVSWEYYSPLYRMLLRMRDKKLIECIGDNYYKGKWRLTEKGRINLSFHGF